MCTAVRCPDCKRPDWRGCGAHVEQVLGHIPPAERCQCRQKAGEEAPKKSKSWWR